LRTAYMRVVAPCPEADKTTANGVVHAMLAKP
jgi:hypothetical protein